MDALRGRRREALRRADLGVAILAATVFNMLRGGKTKSLAPRDFMPDPPARPRQDWRTQLALVRQINAAHGGSDSLPTDRQPPANPNGRSDKSAGTGVGPGRPAPAD